MDYSELLPPDSRRKPRFAALVNHVLAQAADLAALYAEELPAALDMESAVGAQLDALGALAGIPRPTSGLSDETFRALLRAEIALHHWPGTNESLPEILAAAFPGQDVRVVDMLNGSVRVESPVSLPLPAKDLYPVPAGIRIV